MRRRRKINKYKSLRELKKRRWYEGEWSKINRRGEGGCK